MGRGDERHPLEKVLAELKRYFGDSNKDYRIPPPPLSAEVYAKAVAAVKTADPANAVTAVGDGQAALALVESAPDTLYAAMYDVQRRPWKLLENGVDSGIHKTTDGGKKWARLGGGLPTSVVHAQEVTIREPWVRGTVRGQKATGAFMQLTATESASRSWSARSKYCSVWSKSRS